MRSWTTTESIRRVVSLDWSNLGTLTGFHQEGLVPNVVHRLEDLKQGRNVGTTSKRSPSQIQKEWWVIAVCAAHKVFGTQVSRTTWFCPNNVCFHGKARRWLVLLPVTPDLLPIMQGMSLSVDKVNFLAQFPRGKCCCSIRFGIRTKWHECFAHIIEDQCEYVQ